MYKKFSIKARFKSFFLAVVFSGLFNFFSGANPGDTTWVTVWNLRKLTHVGSYDTSAVFPVNKRYRKIRLHYILGRYSCPPGSQYCGSWDYTTQIFARPAGKDSVEIARVITPYATDWLSLNKKHDYVVEVTDYASALQGSTAMRFDYSGYSWGFTITLKIEFIEGVPPMDALSVKNIYNGYYPYGNINNSIENYLSPKTYSYTAPANRVFVKNTVSGHGADANNCSEFCSKYYQLKVNNNLISQKQLWRNDCGYNQVYPQTGTWIYDRANWCPGAVVWPIYHDLTTVTNANSNFTVNVDMETYTVTNASGGFNWVSQFVQYSAPNHLLDLSIEDIVSPSQNENYHRENPACMNPIIKIKNVGTDTIKSASFNYGLKGGTILTHSWTGSLKFQEETQVVFPPSTAILSGTASSDFVVSLNKVNGITGDQNVFNDTYMSRTLPVDIFPNKFVINMYTNSSLDTLTQKSETSWKLFDQNNSVLLSRTSLSINSVYVDTVYSLLPGCYKFVVKDTGCDGMSWWANPGAGAGALRIDYINANSSIFPFPSDIGCGYTKYFKVLEPNTVHVIDINKNKSNIDVYPNPAFSQAFIKIDLSQKQNLKFNITDIAGKIINEKVIENVIFARETIELSTLKSGVYFINFTLKDGILITKKLLVQD